MAILITGEKRKGFQNRAELIEVLKYHRDGWLEEPDHGRLMTDEEIEQMADEYFRRKEAGENAQESSSKD